MIRSRSALTLVSLLGAGLVSWSSGCGSSAPDALFKAGPKGSNGSDGDGGPMFGDNGVDGAPGGCVGLQCQQHACPGGGATTVSGVVYDPAGKNPLYDVVVYVPNGPVQPLPSGASCDACNALYTGNPIATALTDAAGKFTLTNVPVGANIPLVIQVGKWRKQITIPTVAACTDNAQSDKSLTLPQEPQGRRHPQHRDFYGRR